MDLQQVTIASPVTGPEAPAAPAQATPQVHAPAALNPTNPAPQKEPERPAWLPEKFKDAEQMAKAYGELEQMLGKPRAPEDPTVQPKPAEQPTQAPTPDAAQEQLQAKGLDLNEFTAEFTKDGKLSDASYTKLAAAGIDKATVDNYVAGQQAIAAQYATELFNAVGGKDEYAKMIDWAKTGLSDAEQKAFDRTINTQDKAAASLAVSGLAARFRDAVGVEPNLMGGRPVSSSDVFRSRAEQVAAIKDPRYANDPAYRADVEAKAIRSTF